MCKSNAITSKEATEGMMRGVSIAVDLIRPTYGGAGTNIVVETKINPKHGIYNDAWTIVQSLKVIPDENGQGYAEKIGLDFAKELCERADKLSGDSRKTTLILLEEILKAGYEADINKLELKRELDKLIPIIEAEIDKQTKQITVDKVEAVATTASENPDTGKLLQEIYQKIGKNGIIHPEGSGTYETSYRFIDAVRLDGTGMLSPDMVHDEQAKKDKVKETRAIYENPVILVTKKKIINDEDINPILKSLSNAEKTNFIIFTQDMDSNVASKLINIHKAGGYNDIYGGFHSMNILIIKAPVLWQGYIFEDFAKCVGATIVEDATGVNYKNLTLNHLGTCDRIEVDNEETLIFGTKDISEHVAQLKAKGDTDSKLRLSWLVNKSAILKLGANSETDLSYKRLKCHDAIRSSELALKYGIVKGGGKCLFEIGNILGTPGYLISESKLSLEDAKKISSDLQEGKPIFVANIDDIRPIKVSTAQNIMAQALKAPALQIMENGITEVLENIVDASMVIKMAVRNAIGIASTILTAGGLTYIPEPTPQEIAYAVATNNNQSFGQN